MLFSTIYIEIVSSLEDKLPHGIFFSFNYLPLNTCKGIIDFQKKGIRNYLFKKCSLCLCLQLISVVF